MKTPTEEGFIALAAGDPATALARFRAALELEPADLVAWHGTVRAARALRIWLEVARALERVLPLTLERADLVCTHLARGRVLDAELGDPAGARRHYEAALLVDPDRAWTWAALAELDLRGHHWSRAVGHAGHGLEHAADPAERAHLLAVQAVAVRRLSLSMGPASTFFRGLRGGPVEVDPAEEALRRAGELRPALAEVSAGWLSDADAASTWLRAHLPPPPPPSWWL